MSRLLVLLVIVVTGVFQTVSYAETACSFIDTVSAEKVGARENGVHALLSLAWMAQEFTIRIRPADADSTCIFDLDEYIKQQSSSRPTKIFSLDAGRYFIYFERKVQIGRGEIPIAVKPGEYYVMRKSEGDIAWKEKTATTVQGTAMWKLHVNKVSKDELLKHSEGETRSFKIVLIVGSVLGALLLGGIIVSAIGQ